ncbi:MAG: DUF1461 domain-containing protein [Caldiserica bacterium]|jgi:integral membrane protein (TIGR01906 family)|nr:DUF1461 domain-containing protein [Caldisericota bacterium]
MGYSNKAFILPRAIFFLLAPLFFLSLTISILAFDPGFFFSLQKGIGYPVTDATYELDRKISSSLFFGVQGENLQEFSQKEILHLEDIHKLLRSLFIFSIFSGLTFLGSTVFLAFNDMKFRKMLFWGFLSSLGFYLILGLLFFLFFDWAFLNFHLAVFSNDYWILGDDYLLYRLFPPELFQKALFPFFFLLIFLTSLYYILSSAISRKSSRAPKAS